MTKQEPTRSRTVPGWLPPVLYGVLTLFLFRRFVISGEMLFGMDTLSLGYMARAFYAEALRGGIFPLWNPILLGGTPFLDSLAGGDSLYPTALLLLIMEPFRALGWKLVLHVFLAGLFTFGWIRSLGCSRPAALLAGVAYLLAPHMVTLVYPGHDGKLFVSALTPLLFWATEAVMARGGLRALVGMAAVIGLVILTTHFQQAYFLFGAVGIYAGVRTLLLWRQGAAPAGAGRRFGAFLLFSALGAGAAGIQLLPAVDYVLESSRRTATTTRASEEGSVAYSSSWSMHPEEAASMVVPEFAGNSAGGAPWAEGTYWGRNPFKLNHEYAGLVVLLLAGLAFFGARVPGIRFTFLGIGGVGLLYTLGTHTPVWRIFYEVVPGISLFRAPSIAAFLFGFSAVTLMAFGVDRVLELTGWEGGGSRREGHASGRARDGEGKEEERAFRGILLFLAGATVILLLGTVLASSGALTTLWTGFLYPGLGESKAEALGRAGPFISRGFFLATLLAGIVLALSWGALRGKLPAELWLVGLGVLLVVDLARVDAPFIQTFDFRSWARPDANIEYLLERQAEEPPFRILALGGSSGLMGQDVRPGMFGLELANGHHPNDLGRYRELVGGVGSGQQEHFFDLEGRSFRGLNLPLLSILNVRYVIWPVNQMGGLPGGEPLMATSLDGRTAYEAVYEIPTLPRARLVGEARVLSDGEAVPYLLSPAFRPEAEVVLSGDPPLELAGGPVEGEVRWLERGLNRHRLRVDADQNALLVVADNWYPSWRARVDGREVPVLRANHTLRAVPVEAGSHEVEVFYDAGGFHGGLLSTVLCTLILLGTLTWGWLRDGKGS